jgi:beta-N-acetylhexosaminidase
MLTDQSLTRTRLRHKIGPLLMAGFDGITPTPHLEQLIRDWHLGGVILFRRNISDCCQIAGLTGHLQALAASVASMPLLLAIDQEGGMVARIETGITPLPSAMSLREAGSVTDCEALTRIANEELLALGINVNFAPVLDVNNNPGNPVIGVRAFGETVPDVCDYGLAALRGIQAAGVLATIKHFPGHGDTAVDSHLGLPVVPHDRARLDKVELAPFRAAIAAGAAAVMSAHVVFPAIEADPGCPSTLSSAVLTGLLRGELGFDGLVFTDCLEMAAIADGVGVVEGALAAFRAGADILLVSHREDRQLAVLEALLAAVESGEISEARLDESLLRIERARSSLPARAGQLQAIASPERIAFAQHVQARGIRVSGEVTPLDRSLPVLVIEHAPRTRTEIDELQGRGATLAAQLAAEGYQVEAVYLPLAPDAETMVSLCARAADSPQCVLVSYNAVLWPQQQALLNDLPTNRLWHVAGRLPYDLDASPARMGRLTAFANTASAMQAVLSILIGRK